MLCSFSSELPVIAKKFLFTFHSFLISMMLREIWKVGGELKDITRGAVGLGFDFAFIQIAQSVANGASLLRCLFGFGLARR